MSPPIDLDANATTQPCEEAVRAAGEGMALWRNPSSIHRGGQEARRRVEQARASLARLVGAPPKTLILTSSATESVDLAIRGGLALDRRRDRPILVTTHAEHAAVRELALHLDRCGRVEARWAPVDTEGLVDPDGLAPLLDGAAMCSIQWVSSETGAVQPVTEIARLCRERGVLYHCDATQWVGKMPTDLSAMADKPDLLSFAPHKFHGLKGVGVLVAEPAPEATLRGAQELGRRGGTENVPGILAAGAAADAAAAWLANPDLRERQRMLRDRLESELLESLDGRVNGAGRVHSRRRIWNTTNLMLGVEAEPLLLALSERGIAASAGSACSSGSLEPSEALLVMGLTDDEARRSVRFSLSRMTTEDEIERAVAGILDAAARWTL